MSLPSDEYRVLPLELIDPPSDPIRERVDQEKFEELVASVATFGVLSPIKVRPKGDRYEVVYGHMRYMAALKAGLKEVPCLVSHLTPVEADLVALEENVARQDMDPLEEARFYHRLIHRYGMSVNEIAERRGVSAATVRARLDLLSLPQDLQRLLEQRKINVSVALELGRVRDPDKRAYFLDQVLNYGASISVVKKWVMETLVAEGYKPAPAPVATVEAADVVKPGGAAICNLCDQAFRPEQTIGLFLCLDDYRLFQQFKEAYRAQSEQPVESV